MSKLLETLTVTRRKVVGSLNCSYQLLIYLVSCDDVFTSLQQAVTCQANCTVLC